MSAIGQGVSLNGLYHEDFQYPFNLSGSVTSDDLGKPMSLDTSAANTAKVAGIGDAIIGRLETFEDRTIEGIKVGTIALRGGWRFPILDADPLAVGDTAVGAGAGKVKKAATPNPAMNLVVEVTAGYATIIR